MLLNLTIGRYLCYHKHRRTNLNAQQDIPLKASFFWKRIQQSGLITEMMIQKKLKGLERMEVSITSIVKVFLGNKYNSYIQTARNT